MEERRDRETECSFSFFAPIRRFEAVGGAEMFLKKSVRITEPETSWG